jgi:hypothetical protein
MSSTSLPSTLAPPVADHGLPLSDDTITLLTQDFVLEYTFQDGLDMFSEPSNHQAPQEVVDLTREGPPSVIYIREHEVIDLVSLEDPAPVVPKSMKEPFDEEDQFTNAPTLDAAAAVPRQLDEEEVKHIAREAVLDLLNTTEKEEKENDQPDSKRPFDLADYLRSNKKAKTDPASPDADDKKKPAQSKKDPPGDVFRSKFHSKKEDKDEEGGSSDNCA